MKKLMIQASLMAAVTLMSTFAFADDDVSKQVSLLLSEVSTYETRVDQAWKPTPMPSLEESLPYSEVDLANLGKEAAEKAIAENLEARKKHFESENAIRLRNYQEVADHRRQMEAKLTGTVYGKRIIMMLDRFAGYVMQERGAGDCLMFFHRMDTAIANTEQKLKGDVDGSLQIATSDYFVKLVFLEPREAKSTVDLTKTDRITRRKVTIQATVEVQDGCGRLFFAENVEGSADANTSNATSSAPIDGKLMENAIDDVLKQIAKKVCERFVAQVSFQAVSKGGKNDENFSQDSATLLVDGAAQNFDTPINLLKVYDGKPCKHMVKVEHDGYEQVGPLEQAYPNDTVRKIQMAYAMCDLTVNVKGPAGDADFDASSATIEVTNDETSETLSSGDPLSIMKGKYTLSVTMDGYVPVTKSIVLNPPKKVETVMLKKAAEEAAE